MRIALALALLLSPLCAHADGLQLQSQARFVSLSDLVLQSTETVEAPDSGPFEASLTAGDMADG